MVEFKDKERVTIYVDPKIVRKTDELFKKQGYKSRSDFIEKAMDFYCGYTASENFVDYYPEIIITTVNAALDSFEDRMASLLFKFAVELNMVLHILAASSMIDSETLTKLKGKCIDEIKRLHGNISFEEAYKYQKGK